MNPTDTTSERAATIAPALQGEQRRLPGPGGAAFNFRFWRAAQPEAAAIYLHGIAGHSLWFSAAADRLAAAGITTYGLDRRGSGLNRHLGSGLLGHHQTMLDDIRRFAELAQRELPGRKVFLLAGCWGAKPGVVFAARHPDLLDGLALLAPALRVRVSLPVRDLLGVAVQLGLNPRQRFPIPLRTEQYTDNPAYRAFIAADPLRLLTASARFFLETARLDRLAARAPERITLPTLMLCGGRDAIVDPAGLRAWFDRLAAADREMVIYPTFAHILEFEPERERYFDDLTRWLRRQIEGRSPRDEGALVAG